MCIRIHYNRKKASHCDTLFLLGSCLGELKCNIGQTKTKQTTVSQHKPSCLLIFYTMFGSDTCLVLKEIVYQNKTSFDSTKAKLFSLKSQFCLSALRKLEIWNWNWALTWHWFILRCLNLKSWLTSGMSLVWTQSMGLPTYCLAVTRRLKARQAITVMV